MESEKNYGGILERGRRAKGKVKRIKKRERRMNQKVRTQRTSICARLVVILCSFSFSFPIFLLRSRKTITHSLYFISFSFILFLYASLFHAIFFFVLFPLYLLSFHFAPFYFIDILPSLQKFQFKYV